MAELWNRNPGWILSATSLTNLWKGSFRISNSVLDVYLRISRKATVPGLYRCGFLTPPYEGADAFAALVTRKERGRFTAIDFLAVCFVLAILFFFTIKTIKQIK